MGAVTVEEIEILVKANIEDALSKTAKLRTELKKALSAQLPNLQSQFSSAKQLYDQYGNVITSSVEKARTATQGAGETIKKTAQTAKQAAEAEKAALESVAKEQERINALVKEHEAARKAEKAEHIVTEAPYNKSAPATATDMFAAREAQASAANNVPMVNSSKLSGWQKFTARYYAILDNVKSALSKVGVYGKESIGAVKKQTDSATSATKKYGDQVKQTASQSKSLFGSLGQTIKTALVTAVLYKGLQKLFDFIKTGIQSAVDAPEIENLFRVAFGNAGDQAAAFAEKLRSSLGIDIYAAKQMLGTFQEIEMSMGIGQKTATKMSESLTLLANDISSLYNVDPEQASENLQSALTGQWRAVRKYGYTLSEATIKQVAYKNGLAQTGAELTEQQKVVARYLALVEQSKNAQGDMQRTLGNVANQLRILKQNFTAAGRSIGSAFIPFIQAAVPWLNAFMIVLQRVGVTLSKWTYSLFGMNYDAEMKKQQQNIVTGLNAVSDAEDAAGKSAEEAAKKQKGSLADFDELKVIEEPKSSKDKSGAGTGAGGLDFDVPTLDVSKATSPAEKMADKIQAAFAKMRAAAKPTEEAFGRFVKSLNPLKTFVAKGIEDFYHDFLVPIGKWALGKGIPEFLDTLTKFNYDVDWSTINKALDDLWKVLEPFAEHIGDGLNWFLRNVLEPLAAWCMNEIVPRVLKIVADAIKLIDDAAQAAKPAFEWIFENILKPFADHIGKAIVDALDAIEDALKLIDDLLNGDFSAAAKDGKKLLGDLGQLISDISIINIPEAIKKVQEKVGEFGKWWNDHIATWWNENVAPWFSKEKWEELYNQVKESAQSKWQEVSDWWRNSTLVTWWSNDVAPWFTKEKWTELFDSIKQALTGKWDETTAWWNSSGPVQWWNSDVAPWFTKEKWMGLFDSIKLALSSKWSEVTTWWSKTAIVNWWNNDVVPWFTAKKWTDMMSGVGEGFKTTFKNAVNGAIALFNSFIGWVNEKMHFEWDDFKIMGKTIVEGGSIQLFRIPSIPQLAQGGVLTESILFNGGEYAGAAQNPEIVAPQKIMRETVMDANGPLIVEIMNEMEDLKEAIVYEIRNKDLSFQMDGTEFDRATRGARESEDQRIGEPLFSI